MSNRTSSRGDTTDAGRLSEVLLVCYFGWRLQRVRSHVNNPPVEGVLRKIKNIYEQKKSTHKP